MDEQDQDRNKQSRKMTYTKTDQRKMKIVKNKIMDEKLKTAMKTWLEQEPSQKCSQYKKS